MHILHSPPVLSVFGETDGTLKYFDQVIAASLKCCIGDEIFFDLSDVEIITPDAIMYLIAVIKNLRRIRMLKIRCSGNTPRNVNALKMIEQCGFFDFVSLNEQRNIETDNQYMKISNGQDVRGKLAGSFCDFVQCGGSSIDTKHLYRMIIELMTNTFEHAYEGQEKKMMLENWYMCAQDTGETVHFVFLDTGVGIPKTVLKRFREKIKDVVSKNDAFYLKSALQGEFRSETRQAHRGKGLPGIYEDASNKIIANLSIISGRGKCTVKDNKMIEAEDLSENFEGTLFVWDILKEKI